MARIIQNKNEYSLLDFDSEAEFEKSFNEKLIKK